MKTQMPAHRLTIFFCVLIATIAVLASHSSATTKGLSQIVTPDLQPQGDLSLSPNYHPDRIMGYIVFTYTFHLWAKDKKEKDQSVPGG